MAPACASSCGSEGVVRARLLLVLVLAVSAGGCSVDRILAAASPDRIITGLGLPQRGFATDALFPDTDPGKTPPPEACGASGCPQARQFCVVRGYRPGSAGYDRCIVSVEQNLRQRGP